MDQQIWDDRYPPFIQKLYQMLQSCCTELFYSRASQALQYAGIHPSSMGKSEESKSSISLFPDLVGISRDHAIDEMIMLHPLHGSGPVSGNVIEGMDHIISISMSYHVISCYFLLVLHHIM